jgi:plasmid stabilization system protein ParE
MIVRLLPEAEEDLESIADYIARDAPKRAISFTAELRAQVNGLAAMAESFPFARLARHPQVRRRTYRRYGIFYSINAAASCVDVLRILHGSRDLTKIFNP